MENLQTPLDESHLDPTKRVQTIFSVVLNKSLQNNEIHP